MCRSCWSALAATPRRSRSRTPLLRIMSLTMCSGGNGMQLGVGMQLLVCVFWNGMQLHARHGLTGDSGIGTAGVDREDRRWL